MNDRSEKPESKTSTLHCLKIQNPGLNCSLETNLMSVKKQMIITIISSTQYFNYEFIITENDLILLYDGKYNLKLSYLYKIYTLLLQQLDLRLRITSSGYFKINVYHKTGGKFVNYILCPQKELRF